MLTVAPPSLSREQEVQWITVTRWNMSKIKTYLAKNGRYTPDELDRLELEYKRYMLLRAIYSDLDLPMSVPVDPFWHAHILFTSDYRDFCQAIAGRFIDHKPMESDAEKERLNGSYRQNTLAKYIEHFGEPDRAFWPRNGAVCLCNGGDCG